MARCGPGAVTDPCEPDLLHTGGSALGPTLFLAIKYAECLAQPVRAMPAGCACEEEACEYSRIRDSFQIECLVELPPFTTPEGQELFNWIATPPEPTEPIDVGERANIIEIVFTAPIDPSSVIDGTTFIVRGPSGAPQPGTPTVSSNVVRWVGDNDFRFPRNEEFTVTLVGDLPDAITSIEPSRLDGEAHKQLPSGDNNEGGNFVFKLGGAQPPIL